MTTCWTPYSPPTRGLQSGAYEWWEAAAVMLTQVALCVFNGWFLLASLRRRR